MCSLVLALALPIRGGAEDAGRIGLETVPIGIVSQRLYRDSPNACGPASLLNVLKFGNESCRGAYQELLGGGDETRLRYLVDRYFRTRRSVVAPGQTRWGMHGVFARDLAAGWRELFEEHGCGPVNEAFLDRIPGETDGEHLRRAHGWMRVSLEAGVLPVLSLRAFAVKRREETGHEPRWEVMRHHFVAITSVPARLADEAWGFEGEGIDPATGKTCRFFLHEEPHGHPFTALKGNEVEGEWLGGREFLLLTSAEIPTLRPRHLAWSERFVVAAHFLAGRF